MSIRRFLLKLWLKNFEKPKLATSSVEKLRRSFERMSRTFFRPPPGTIYDIVGMGDEANSVPTLTVMKPGKGPIILYFHGGGFVFGSPHTHRALAAWLSHYSGLKAALVSYRRAPEDPFPTALIDGMIAYRFATRNKNGVIIGGDSAGGGLALALLAEIKRKKLPMPLGTFAFSPVTDLSFSGNSIRDNAKADVILPVERAGEMVDMYLNGADPKDPRASPLFADFSGASPVWLAVSDTEILLDDSLRLAERLKEQGVSVTLVQEHDLPHVWPLFRGYLPEADKTLRSVADWIRSLSRPAADS